MGDGPWLTTAETGELIGLSDRQVRNLIADGVILAIDWRRPGAPQAAWRVCRASLEDTMRARANDGGIVGNEQIAEVVGSTWDEEGRDAGR